MRLGAGDVAAIVDAILTAGTWAFVFHSNSGFRE